MEKTNQTGFSIVEVLLILIVVGILGFTGWYVYHSRAVANKSYSSSSSVSTHTAATNPYAGWKQYCSNVGNACFKYPSGWTTSVVDSGDPSIPNGISVKNPTDSKLSVDYNPQVQGVGGACQPGICSMDVLSIDTPPATSTSNLRVVKAVFMNSDVSSFVPMYCVTYDSYVSQLGLKAGKVDVGFVALMFKNPSANNSIEELCANPPYATVANFKAESDALEWLNGVDAKTAGNILNSIELK